MNQSILCFYPASRCIPQVQLLGDDQMSDLQKPTKKGIFVMDQCLANLVWHQLRQLDQRLGTSCGWKQVPFSGNFPRFAVRQGICIYSSMQKVRNKKRRGYNNIYRKYFDGELRQNTVVFFLNGLKNCTPIYINILRRKGGQKPQVIQLGACIMLLQQTPVGYYRQT